jgi:S-adenosylmethionine decarboxylase
MSFGTHLMLDCQSNRKDLLGDMAFIYQVLDELPDLIGMTKIIPPYVFPYSGKVPEDKGVTGVVIIAESHLTIHTFSDKDYLFCDIFSCNSFDTDKAIEYLTQAFEISTYEKHVATRGVYFPRAERQANV